MALTLNGSTRWPVAKELQRFGETHCAGTPSQVRDILERIAEALRSTSADVRTHMKEDLDFVEIGERMLREWEKGAALSLEPA
jgi:serine/threonine-protein kinase HipA